MDRGLVAVSREHAWRIHSATGNAGSRALQFAPRDCHRTGGHGPESSQSNGDMNMETNPKVTTNHLKRNAYLYVRQSTPRQVMENTESRERQYALRRRALAFGWLETQIVVIDSDLGQSGASAADRVGFQRLVTEVSLGRAGMVLGLEVSRLARNSADWHRLLEICALSDTLILDEDGIYNPTHFNDRLLLGLKGTMSEAELHMIHARMRGGTLNKAKRGELVMYPPVGLAYDADHHVVLEPDKQVQESLRLVFEAFRRLGSAFAVVQHFRQQGLLFPRRRRRGPDHEDLVWKQLSYSLLIRILHNPRYAGAFVYGRTKSRKGLHGIGSSATRLPVDQWQVLLRAAHPGYISWEQFEANQVTLQQNRPTLASEVGGNNPPREGPALLQGLALCGICGQRMHPRYHATRARLVPYYVCPRKDTEGGAFRCQHIAGATLDDTVGQLLLEAVTPVALEVALTVEQEIQARLEETDRLRRIQLERTRYEANLARRRYMQVDPDLRLVADSLEADWNEKLQRLAEAQQQYDRQCEADRRILGEQQRRRLFTVATDFHQLWKDPKTSDKDRKRIARLLIEDVTLIKGHQITAHVRFKGGMSRTLTLPLPLNAWQRRRLPTSIIVQIDHLLDRHPPHEIARLLNEQGLLSTERHELDGQSVSGIAYRHGLKSRQDRLRASGMLTITEVAQLLNISESEVWRRRKEGLLSGQAFGVNKYLYKSPEPASCKEVSDEMQYEA